MTKGLAPPPPEQIRRELDETRTSLPILSLLDDLFTDPKMFRSYGRFRAAGFSLVDHAPQKMMAGSHKRAKGYMFKKFDDDKSSDMQLRNYLHRIEGARLIGSFISERGFSRVVAPRKWLYELPPSFPKRYLVVAEKVDLVSKIDTARRYARIGSEQLSELATMLYYFRGLNSTASNLPFTEDGKIAFIDTERWHHDKDLLHKIGDWLPADRRSKARRVFKELKRQGAQPFASAFR